MSEIHESLSVPEEVPRTEKRDIKRLMESLKEMEEEAERLRQIERRFLTTREAELLKPFDPKTPIVIEELKEAITEPLYLSSRVVEEAKSGNEVAIKAMEHIRNDARLFNPDAEVRIVELADGREALAVIGVDFKEFRSFLKLREEERKTQYQMEEARQQLSQNILNSQVETHNISYSFGTKPRSTEHGRER